MSAMRTVSRHVFRRLSTGGKVLSEEEKAAENVYIKKLEKEKLEKLARKAAETGEKSSGEAAAAAAAETEAATEKSSTNYVAIGGGIAALVGIGWYFGSRGKKSEEIKN